MNTKNGKKLPDNGEKNMRDKILDVASELFRRKGFDGTSMQDIAGEVGILKGSIYYYFSSKNEIIREVLEKGIEPVVRSGEEIIKKELPPRKMLKELINNHLRYIMEHNDTLVIFFQERGKISHAETDRYLHNRNRYEGMFRSVLEKGIETGEFNQKIDASLTTFAILGMCNWIIQWYNPKGPKSAEEIIEHMLYLICDLMLTKIESPCYTDVQG